MKNLRITDKGLSAVFIGQVAAAEIEYDPDSTYGEVAGDMKKSADAICAMIDYYEFHEYNIDDVRAVRKMLANIVAHAEHMGNALALLEAENGELFNK